MSLERHELSQKPSRSCSCLCSIWLVNHSLCLLDHEISQVTQVKVTPSKVSVRTPKKHFDNSLPNYQDAMTAILLCWPLSTQRIDAFKCQVPADKGQLSLEWLYFNPLKRLLTIRGPSSSTFPVYYENEYHIFKIFKIYSS